MLVTSRDGWQAHIAGAGRLLQFAPPELYCTGVNHRLFIGIRPLLVGPSLF